MSDPTADIHGSLPQWTDHAWERRSDLAYRAELNYRYHQKRERFLSSLDRFGQAAALIAGTGAASELLASPKAKALAGLAVAIVTIPTLVFGWADRARHHAQLRAEYVNFRADLEAAGVLDSESLDKFAARLIRLNAQEPPALSTLVRVCQNEMAIAQGRPADVEPIAWYQRWLCHLVSFSVHDQSVARKPAAPGRPS